MRPPVGRDGFHDSLRGSGEHPEGTILPLHDHVFVPVGIRKRCGPATFPGGAFVGRDEDIGTPQGIEFGKAAFENIEPSPLIERDWKHPFTGF